jgi:hypothetical protein
VILQSAAVCPACRKHLRFEPGAVSRAAPTSTPLRVEGSIHHPDAGEAWEYSMMVLVKNERGEEVARQVVGVGALQPGEGRTFSFAVEVFAPEASVGKQDATAERVGAANVPNASNIPAQPAPKAALPAPPSPAAKREALRGVNRS